VGWIVTVLIVLSPNWGPPGDFYAGWPYRFYVTQDDVDFERVWIYPLLLDLAIVGIPVFAVIFTLVWLLGIVAGHCGLPRGKVFKCHDPL
jgi:hypothetical protein